MNLRQENDKSAPETVESMRLDLERCHRAMEDCQQRLAHTEDLFLRAQETLRETKAALEFTLSATHLGAWSLDLANDTSRRSPGHDQCFGYHTPVPETDWGIEAFSQHLHPDDRQRVISSLRLASREWRDWSSEFRVIWPDESVHLLSASGTIYRPRNTGAARMLGILMDVTDRKQAEEALAASGQLARGQVDVLTKTLAALARESSPDLVMEDISRTITEQFGAHSLSVWQRNIINGRVSFAFAFEDGVILTKDAPQFAGVDLALPMEGQWPWPDVLLTGKPDLISDIRNVPPFPLCDRLLKKGIVTVLLVPMWIAGRLDGVVGLRFVHKRLMSPEEIDLAQTLANHAMLALQLAHLTAQNRESAVVDERNRLAREIHDTLAQGFTGIIVQLEAAEDAKLQGLSNEAHTHFDRARALARESLKEARRSVQALRPRALEKEQLCQALSTQLAKMSAGSRTQCEFSLQGTPRELPREWDEHILRIFQEALTNVLRHAKASHFKAMISYETDAVRLELCDTGQGFDAEGEHDGYGLLGIRERVERMDGKLQIKSAADGGTTILVRLPLPS
ncbi:MAG: histidine kinase [Rhodanobacter sp.]